MAAPKTSDGKPIVLPNLFPGYVTLYVTGAGDSNSVRGEGAEFRVSRSTAGDETFEWSFLDYVYAAGGALRCLNAQRGDWISVKAVAPATPISVSSGGTGNANIVDPGIGVPILIVPAAGNGSHDVDLSAAVPVPSEGDENGTADGYWDWSAPGIGKGLVSPSATPGAAQFHLFSIPIDLARFVNKLPLLGDATHDITVPAIKPKKILPHWKFVATIHNEAGDHALDVVWFITVAREKTL